MHHDTFFAWIAVRSRDLETLLWVARLGGIGAAARHMNLTQPTITRRIQELERVLGATLFERTGRHIVPTATARLLLAHAERVLSEVAAMHTAASGQVAIRGTIRAGVTELVALTWFDRLLVRVAEAYPNLIVEMDVDLASRLVDRLARRRLDMLFLPGPVPVAGVVRGEIGISAIRWVATGALLGDRISLSPQEVADLPIIMSPQGSDVHGMVMRWFAAAGVQPKRVSLCNSMSVVSSLVRKGLGISPLSTELFAEDLSSGELVALPEQPPLTPVEYSVAYIPSRDLPVLPQIAAFAQEESWFARKG
jgi:DNA-binding transcriptional LysR family regulator